MGKMMAELYGKKTGYNKGKGGSMHIASVEKGSLYRQISCLRKRQHYYYISTTKGGKYWIDLKVRWQS